MKMRGKSILEVLVVFTLLILYVRVFNLTVFARLEHNVLGRSYFTGFITVLTPIFVLLLTKRSFESYGLTLKEWRNDLEVGMICYLVQLIPWGLGFWLLWTLQTSYREVMGSIILSVTQMVALFLALSILRRREANKAVSARPHAPIHNLLILVILLLLPIIMGIYLDRLTLKVVSAVVWQFLFSGFGEEILFRGYFQSRINQEFGCPFSFLGVKFGIGLFVTSLLFASVHILNPFNPFAGRLNLAWEWGLWTFFAGLFFGFIKEKTSSIIAPGIAHGLPDAVGEALSLIFSASL